MGFATDRRIPVLPLRRAAQDPDEFIALKGVRPIPEPASWDTSLFCQRRPVLPPVLGRAASCRRRHGVPLARAPFISASLAGFIQRRTLPSVWALHPTVTRATTPYPLQQFLFTR